MRLNQYEWIDSLGYVWYAIQSPDWADEMLGDGVEVRLVQKLIE